jgi:DNA-binding CsgD family transcriptional regulator
VLGPQPSRRHELVGRHHETVVLQELLSAVRAGGSATLLVRGEPGVGKSALLQRLVDSANDCQVVRAVGVEGEIDLPFAGLQQLCRSMLGLLDRLPVPQRDALQVAFGLAAGEPPDLYLVGLAALTLLSEVAATQPLVCVVDDVQWLDPGSIGALAFVARRLGADSVALVFGSRELVDELDGVPELPLEGLGAADARALLDSVLLGRVDEPVRERFLAECRGNPLALIELPRSLTAAEAAAGLLPRSGESLTDRIQQGFEKRLAALPADTRRLLLLAGAEPVGDPGLLLRAASHLACGDDAADAAETAGLVTVGDRLSFRHPLVRAAAYQSATHSERRAAHAALAEETEAAVDPDRRAWHRAQAAQGPDEEIAAELEATAERAKARGGLAAAGAFLERSARLTPDPTTRVARTLDAAEVMHEAGALDAAENLLRTVDSSLLSELQALRAERVRAEIMVFRGEEAEEGTLVLLAAAKGLRRLDPALGQAAYLQALTMAFTLSGPEVLKQIADDLDNSSATESDAIAEMLLRGWGQMLEHGYPVGTELLRDATVALREKGQLEESDLPLVEYGVAIAQSLWDFESWEVLARRGVQVARDAGSLLILPRLLRQCVDVWTCAGDLEAAQTADAEVEAICHVIRGNLEHGTVSLEAWRLETVEALARIAEGERPDVASFYAEGARALVHVAAGRYDEGLAAAQRACDSHPLGVRGWTLPDLIEAAVRTGELERARTALGQLVDRTQLASTEWALGLEARSAALLTEDAEEAEALYRTAVDRLSRVGVRPDLGRAHLLYGEWLRREGRKVDARRELRAAYGLFSDIGAPAFAERARRELAATGETARQRTDATRADLTPQELQIVRMALDGQTNPEIAGQLFLSPRTVEWHLTRVYGKLRITSRRELRGAVPPPATARA